MQPPAAVYSNREVVNALLLHVTYVPAAKLCPRAHETCSIGLCLERWRYKGSIHHLISVSLFRLENGITQLRKHGFGAVHAKMGYPGYAQPSLVTHDERRLMDSSDGRHSNK